MNNKKMLKQLTYIILIDSLINQKGENNSIKNVIEINSYIKTFDGFTTDEVFDWRDYIEINFSLFVKGYKLLKCNSKIYIGLFEGEKFRPIFKALEKNKVLKKEHYPLVLELIKRHSIKFDYKKHATLEIPEWVKREIEMEYQEQFVKINDGFAINEIQNFLDQSDSLLLEHKLNQKGVLILLIKVLNELYGKSDYIDRIDDDVKKECLLLLKEHILPLINYEIEEEKLEECINNAAKSLELGN